MSPVRPDRRNVRAADTEEHPWGRWLDFASSRSPGEARVRSQKLIVALRRQRKQARLMATTLNTLRQLKLQEVAE